MSPAPLTAASPAAGDAPGVKSPPGGPAVPVGGWRRGEPPVPGLPPPSPACALALGRLLGNGSFLELGGKLERGERAKRQQGLGRGRPHRNAGGVGGGDNPRGQPAARHAALVRGSGALCWGGRGTLPHGSPTRTGAAPPAGEGSPPSPAALLACGFCPPPSLQPRSHQHPVLAPRQPGPAAPAPSPPDGSLLPVPLPLARYVRRFRDAPVLGTALAPRLHVRFIRPRSQPPPAAPGGPAQGINNADDGPGVCVPPPRPPCAPSPAPGGSGAPVRAHQRWHALPVSPRWGGTSGDGGTEGEGTGFGKG